MAAALLAWGLSPLAHRYLGPTASPILRGLGLAVGAVLIAGALVPPFDRGAPALAAWIMGGALLQASSKATRIVGVPAALGILLVAFGCVAAWLVAGAWPEGARLRAAVAGGGALAAAGLLARWWLVKKAPRLAPSPAGILVVAALSAGYVAYRPLVAGRVANLPLYEWTLGAGAAVLLLGRLRRSARDASVPEAWTGEARRHRSDAIPSYDPRMPALAAAVSRYLDTGEGFEEYRASLLRAAPHAAPSFRKALQALPPVQGRGRSAKTARAERLARHQRLMELHHGEPAPAVRTHP